MKFWSLRNVDVRRSTEILSMAEDLPLLGTRLVEGLSDGGARGVERGMRVASSSISTFWFRRRFRAVVFCFSTVCPELCEWKVGEREKEKEKE